MCPIIADLATVSTRAVANKHVSGWVKGMILWMIVFAGLAPWWLIAGAIALRIHFMKYRIMMSDIAATTLPNTPVAKVWVGLMSKLARIEVAFDDACAQPWQLRHSRASSCWWAPYVPFRRAGPLPLAPHGLAVIAGGSFMQLRTVNGTVDGVWRTISWELLREYIREFLTLD